MNIDSFQAQPSNPLIINLDVDDDAQSELISAHSGETLTLLGDKALIIKALETATTDAEYDLLVAQILREHKIKINGITYIKYALYRHRKSKRKV